MAIVPSTPTTYGDVDGLVAMLMAACDDAKMNDTLEKILSQPDDRRRNIVRALLLRFREKKAPKSLHDAFACLLDDAVAEKAYETIFHCKRKA